MKDKTSIFKHSGAGTGFYRSPDWLGDHLQNPDYEASGEYL